MKLTVAVLCIILVSMDLATCNPIVNQYLSLKKDVRNSMNYHYSKQKDMISEYYKYVGSATNSPRSTTKDQTRNLLLELSNTVKAIKEDSGKNVEFCYTRAAQEVNTLLPNVDRELTVCTNATMPLIQPLWQESEVLMQEYTNLLDKLDRGLKQCFTMSPDVSDNCMKQKIESGKAELKNLNTKRDAIDPKRRAIRSKGYDNCSECSKKIVASARAQIKQIDQTATYCMILATVRAS